MIDASNVVYRHHTRLPDNVMQFCRKENGEWIATEDNMAAAAKRVIAAHPDKPHLAITVYERCGWFLTFYTDGTIIGTANDAAVFPPQAERIREMLRDKTWEFFDHGES